MKCDWGSFRGQSPFKPNTSPCLIKGKPEGASAPSETIIPLPLSKGKGIKGIGLINNLLTHNLHYNLSCSGSVVKIYQDYLLPGTEG